MEELISMPDLSETDDFESLFKNHYPMVVRQIMRIIPSQSIAEDIAQDVFVRFYRMDRSSVKHIPAWLIKMAIHTSYNYVRSEKRHLARIEKESLYVTGTTISTESRWLQRDEIATVRDILAQMDERERDLLLMKYSGFSYDELAEAVNINKGSVGTFLSRAKERFRKKYKQVRGDD
ncbi:RNA polymerase sigma factor, sigma-70 family [Thermoactinomyces sp. DSM 45891]|uniref:RNA polymerase sigma factor SigX n=1 Tax=Thermoactinomyces sp. DSM 45891 TaxID=1761907 RepID=UPI0009211B03|nr:RNA polymerase sigma factor SigX [Thermoactinomyces sp. DSM 45891]SFX20313.1 RNA polymerase sigma factor, sigma-70 family [Thermoactinomyces sp. DSM 45891]